MGLFDFIASIVGSLVTLAWPAAVFGSVWIFRNKIKELLPYARFKYKDWEVSLDRAEKTEAALPPPPAPPPDIPEVQPKADEAERFQSFAEYSPRSAIAAKRVEVESALRNWYVTLPNATTISGRRPSMSEMIRLLRIGQKLDDGTLLLLDEILEIANQAVHGDGTITTEDALRYAEIANKTITRISANRWFEPPQDD
jgi:hypothetical protein